MQKKKNSEKQMLKYQRLKEDLMKKIEDGVYASSKCMPSERELCETYDASRMTVRKAIGELEAEGILYKIRGKGTFVKENQKIDQPLFKLTGFTEDMLARGMKPGSQTLLLEVVPANEVIAGKLLIPQGSDIIMLRRLRLADEEPMAIETSYLNYEIFHKSMEKMSEQISMYALMRNELHIYPKHAIQSIEVSPLLGWEARLLGNDGLKTALHIQRQTFGDINNPIEYVESKYRSDKYKFNIELYDLS